MAVGSGETGATLATRITSFLFLVFLFSLVGLQFPLRWVRERSDQGVKARQGVAGTGTGTGDGDGWGDDGGWGCSEGRDVRLGARGALGGVTCVSVVGVERRVVYSNNIPSLQGGLAAVWFSRDGPFFS